MAKPLIYEPKRWEKERKNIEWVLKDFARGNKNPVWAAGVSLQTFQSIRLKALIDGERDIAPSQRNYHMLYSQLQLKYKILAGKSHLMQVDEKQCIDYVYLSGMCGILSKLFDTPEQKDARDLTDAKNSVWDFDYALFQLYAIDQPFPQCIHDMNHLYIKLFHEEFDQAEALLSHMGTAMDEKKPYEPYAPHSIRNCMRAIMQKDSKALQNELREHIKAYRKWPAGYSTFIDVYSIAFMKLAHKYGIDCKIDIIEIPRLFFDKDSCRIDTQKVKPPFLEDAAAILKSRGVDFAIDGSGSGG